MEGTGLACDSLNNDTRGGVDEDAHKWDEKLEVRNEKFGQIW